MPRARQLGVLAAKKQTRTRTTLFPPNLLPSSAAVVLGQDKTSRSLGPVLGRSALSFSVLGRGVKEKKEKKLIKKVVHGILLISSLSPYLPFRSGPPFLSSPSSSSPPSPLFCSLLRIFLPPRFPFSALLWTLPSLPSSLPKSRQADKLRYMP
ncbi:hypothetical protein ASPBRDRAFT_407209 [Aspergillus brasiliensis CBS 101740]|uniref:Uncharacterized protein n=1 Tax=Aspergillus brasiliensis (strain CBS 101740 / IMI 381727 / IBT 21946) TaxID=767769 RepID=A0A1L9UXB6_ASPBC|nr:hypothetical protein ASPBRDRAFT_407209 [Aspergillus brasiliensis CBS 101740]